MADTVKVDRAVATAALKRFQRDLDDAEAAGINGHGAAMRLRDYVAHLRVALAPAGEEK